MMKTTRKTTLRNRSQSAASTFVSGVVTNDHADNPANVLGFPTRNMTPARVASIFDRCIRGEWTEGQWLLYHAELRDADLLTLIRQRKAMLRSYRWTIQTDETAEGPMAELAKRQADALNARYSKLLNIGEAIDHLALATFRHYAHVRIGETTLEPLDQWWLLREGLFGAWRWNPKGSPTTATVGNLEAIDASQHLIRVEPHSLFFLALAKWLRTTYSQRWWDAFVEAVSKQGTVVIGPERVPAEQRSTYEDNATAIARGGSGYLPFGSQVIFPNSQRGIVPFSEHISELRDALIRAANGSTLSTVSESGSGTLAGGAHSQTFAAVMHGEAQTIAEVFQAGIDASVLRTQFPNAPVLAWFDLSLKMETDVKAEVDNVLKLSQAGIAVDPEQVAERTGYRLAAVQPSQTPATGDAAAAAPPTLPPTVAGQGGPAALADDAASTALNGAQVASMVDVVRQAAIGEIPKAAVLPILRTAFPAVPDAQLQDIVASLEGFQPATVAETPPANALPNRRTARLANAMQVPPSWVRPVADLIAEVETKAMDGTVSDEDFAAFLAKAKRRLPELFGQMDVEALAAVLEDSMTQAAQQGVAEAREAGRVAPRRATQ